MPMAEGNGETRSKSAPAVRDHGPAVPTRDRGVSALGAIWRTMRLHVAFAVAGGVSLHAVLIGSIFYGIAGGGGSGMDRNFCLPMAGDAGNFPFGENHSCRIQFGYAVATFVFGVILTSVPLLIAIGVFQVLILTWRSYYGRQLPSVRQDIRPRLGVSTPSLKPVLTFIVFVSLAATVSGVLDGIDGYFAEFYDFVFGTFRWKFVPFLVAPALIIYVADVLIRARRARDSG